MMCRLALVLALAGCAAPDMMPAGEAMAPPSAAIWWALGLRYDAHPYPDCNDAAQATAALLREAGDAPRFAVAFTETGEGHMVVTIDDPLRGTIVFDNRYPHPRPWRDLPYRWAEREDASGQWRAVP